MGAIRLATSNSTDEEYGGTTGKSIVARATANQYSTIGAMLTAFASAYANVPTERQRESYILRYSSGGIIKYDVAIIDSGIFSLNNIAIASATNIICQQQKISLLEKIWIAFNINTTPEVSINRNEGNAQTDVWELWA